MMGFKALGLAAAFAISMALPAGPGRHPPPRR